MIVFNSQLWKIVIVFSIFDIVIYGVSIFVEGNLQNYLEIGAIIILSFIVISLFQKQVTTISLDSSNKEVILKEYRPFFLINHYRISLNLVKLKCKKEHITNGYYARVLRVLNIENGIEYKLSEQMLWWEEAVIDQIINEFKKLGVTIE